MIRLLPLFAVLAACGSPSGSWTLETWGEELIAEGIDDTVFADDCTATFEAFEVAIADWEVVRDDEALAGADGQATVDLVDIDPQVLAKVDLPDGTLDRLVVTVDGGGSPSIRAAGTLTCGGQTVSFDWSFTEAAVYDCPLDGLVGDVARTEFTVHGDHLFYDDLVDPDAAIVGQALVDADDGDGVLTADELRAVPVAPLGYGVGPHADVTDLWAFLQRSVTTVGHVDGEGHCDVRLR